MFKVAIDGPSGAGKSTIAKTAAQILGFVYIDTGAMYRTAALACLKENINIKESPEQAIEIVNNISIDIDYIEGEQRIFLNGADVSHKIRTPEVSMGASDVSAIGAVREKLVSLQRELAGTKNVIMDGRDIGTHVLPDADVKIFLTASSKVRAERRFKELLEKGTKVSYDDVLSDIIKRDRQDETREVSPLKKAEDAVLADTSELTLDESIKLVLDIINKKRDV
jgi:cytidylate kinase